MLQQLTESVVVDSMRLPEKIEMLAKMRGWKLSELARQTGIPAQRFSEWKDTDSPNPKRSKGPTLVQAVRLARALGTTVDYLVDDTQEDPPAEIDEGIREVLRHIGRLGAEEVIRRILVAAPASGREARSLGGGYIMPGPEPEDCPSIEDAARQHKRPNR